MVAADWKVWTKTREGVKEELSKFAHAVVPNGVVAVPQVLLREAERTIAEGDQYMRLLEMWAQVTQEDYDKAVEYVRSKGLPVSDLLHL